MKFNDPIDNPTEAIMSTNVAARYGFAPTAAFAATRACAERRAHQLATTTRLPERLEHRARKLGKLVEQENAAVGQACLARAHRRRGHS
jgi:hypothetical protein